jgi:hypothetical protein
MRAQQPSRTIVPLRARVRIGAPYKHFRSNGEDDFGDEGDV